MRKLLFLFVALLATTCLWAHDFLLGDLYYNITSSSEPYTVEVSHYATSSITTATIPATVTYNGTTYSVTSIGYDAFFKCTSLTSLTIPNSVTSIGNCAFQDCFSLTSVTIGNSVTSIGFRAFQDCRSLTSITIPNSVTSIGNYAFENCYSLTSVTIGNSVTSIGFRAFYYCTDLTSITIGNSVTSIGDYAFNHCSSLTSITIPNSVTSIGDRAFSSCSSLTSITLPNSVTSIGSYAFQYCSSLTSIILPNGVTSIGSSAFERCYALTSITIPNSITSIGESAFYKCSSLTSVKIEATTPPALGSNAFPSNLTAIYIPDNTLSTYQQVWGNQYPYYNNETILTLHVEVPGTLSNLIFDAGTRPINVIKLTLTGTLNDDDFACMRETMTSLIDVDLSGITNTSGVNFSSKTNLMRVVLPANLTSIEDWAFCYCHSLTSVTIPSSVTSIGYRAFYDCDALTSVTIPESVTSIGEDAFEICTSLTSITIPNSVTSIGGEAFWNCSSLSLVTLTAPSVEAFCNGQGNSLLRYAGCHASRKIAINGEIITSITIPNSVTSIGNGTFYGCSSLTSITIPNSVTSIGSSAFRGCSSLTSLTIPNSVTSIGSSAFGACSSLTSITCLGITPPNASDLGAPTSTCTLTVPQSAYNAYFRHTYWGQFLNINTGYLVILQANIDQWGEVAGAGLYTQEATITATPYEGYTFMRWSDGNTDNPRTLTVTQDTTLTAEFAIEGGCLVTFVDWDGTVLSSVSVAPGEAATAPADPTREGYTFIGWDKDFSAITDHMTVTAQYQINRYRVRFFDDDTLLKTDSVEYQSAAVAPADPYHEGYTFTGWDQAFDSITSDLDVYAQYEMGEDRDMTIVFTNSEDNDNEILSQSITIKIPAAPEIAGFTFLGWKATDAFISDVITIQAIYEADIPTSAPEVYINPANPAQKLLRNGQVYILQDGQTYTIQGQKL